MLTPMDRYQISLLGEIVSCECICSMDIRISMHRRGLMDMTSLHPEQDLITTFGVSWSNLVDTNGIFRQDTLHHEKSERHHVRRPINR